MKTLSNNTKLKEKRGQGNGADYKPWIKGSEFNSMGTTSRPVDWKTGRTVECVSQGEMLFYYITRFNDHVVDIKEQYPLLPVEDAVQAAKDIEVSYPRSKDGEPYVMSTDFLLLLDNGEQIAISIKSNYESLNKRKTLEKLNIEKKYWDNKNVMYSVILKDDLNFNLAHNIRTIVQYYDIPKNMMDDITITKHLLARKVITTDLEQKNINFKKIANENKEAIEIWKLQNTVTQQQSKLELH